MAHDYVTTGQIGDALGITHQRVAALIREATDFPEPEVKLPNGTRLWRRNVALRWFEEHPRRAYRKSAESTEGVPTNDGTST